MSLEILKQKIADQITEVDGFRLKKLNAIDGMAYSKLFADMPEDADFSQVANGYAFLLSKCIVNSAGEKELDSDEGRQTLLQLDRETFRKLGQAALDWNLGGAKKN